MRRSTIPAGNAFIRVLAVNPFAGEFLVLGRWHDAAGIAALPADDLVRLAVLLAALFPAFGPTGVGHHGLALFLVPEQNVAVAVALHAHVDRGERGRAQVRRAERLAIAT